MNWPRLKEQAAEQSVKKNEFLGLLFEQALTMIYWPERSFSLTLNISPLAVCL